MTLLYILDPFAAGLLIGYLHGSAPLRRVRHKRHSSIPKLLADRQPRFVRTPQELSIEQKRRLAEQNSKL